MISFGIITNGKRPAHLLRQIDSIKSLNVPEYEVLVAGNTTILPPEAMPIPMHEQADKGQLGAMRNAICRKAKYDIIAIADDDILYHQDWYQGLLDFTPDWEVLCTRMLNPDGTRNGDWVTKGGKRGHCLIEYWETDPYLYVTGGRIILRKAVFDRVHWDEEKGFNQEEDIDFSRRLQQAGISIEMNRKMTVTHDDPRYTNMGHKIYLTR